MVMKMKFRSKFDEVCIEPSTPGEALQPEYQLVMKEDGVYDLEQVGYTDLHKLIQSHKDSVDINLIMSRIENGETDLLERAKGFYADVTELPINLKDALNVGLQGERLFENLPVDVKEKFSSYVDMVNNPERLFKALEERNKPVVKMSDEKLIEKASDPVEVEKVISDGE